MITQFDNYKLKQLYNEFNQLYFDSKLPNIPVEYKRIKKSGGRALAKFITKNKYLSDYSPDKYSVTEITGIEISNYRTLNDNKLKGLLIHEMVHIFLYTKNVINTSGISKSHGLEFMEKLLEIQKLVDFDIPLTEESMDVAEHIKSKFYDCIILKNNDKNTYSITIFPNGFLHEHYGEIKSSIKYLIEYYKREVFYKNSDDRFLLNIPVKRKAKNISYYQIKNEDAERILNNSQDINMTLD